MEVLCGLWFLLSKCGTIWDWVGQLGESGEYRVGSMRMVCFHIRSSEGGSPRLSWLRTNCLAPVCKFDYVLAHKGFMGSRKLRALLVTELDDTLPCLQDVHGIVCGPPTDARRGIRWKTCTRVRWTLLDSLIVIVNCCHSWCFRDSRVSCCQVVSLATCKLIRIAAHSRILVIVTCCWHSVVMQVHIVTLIMRMMLTTL
jgi:hypothetical protein